MSRSHGHAACVHRHDAGLSSGGCGSAHAKHSHDTGTKLKRHASKAEMRSRKSQSEALNTGSGLARHPVHATNCNRTLWTPTSALHLTRRGSTRALAKMHQG